MVTGFPSASTPGEEIRRWGVYSVGILNYLHRCQICNLCGFLCVWWHQGSNWSDAKLSFSNPLYHYPPNAEGADSRSSDAWNWWTLDPSRDVFSQDNTKQDMNCGELNINIWLQKVGLSLSGFDFKSVQMLHIFLKSAIFFNVTTKTI